MNDLNKPGQNNRLKQLSPAEKAVVVLLLEGLSNRAIGERLFLSTRTVESHISHALAKSGCQNRLGLTLWLIGTEHTADTSSPLN
ncbi:MAG: response regulator transcription factor [Prochlorococcus sp.]|nr:helix-turn-helix transcriptional regulator [Prochlorococcaceae cyanobacterium Fu_MAG_50]